MPEGHTVHRLAREQQELVGLPLRVTSPQGRFRDGAAVLDGRHLEGVEAKGKHLFHHFEGDAHLHVHLGMAGRFLRGIPPIANARVSLEASGGTVWQLIGPTICAVVDDEGMAKVRARLGPDPLRDDADRADALRRLGASRRTIAEVLLDQSVISGVGNVFRAEVLFVCGIHPRRPAAALAEDEIACLWDTLRRLMARGVEEGRIATIPEDGAGLPDSERRYVYKQDVCRRCGTPVEVETLGARTSYACPVCQPALTDATRGTR